MRVATVCDGEEMYFVFVWLCAPESWRFVRDSGWGLCVSVRVFPCPEFHECVHVLLCVHLPGPLPQLPGLHAQWKHHCAGNERVQPNSHPRRLQGGALDEVSPGALWPGVPAELAHWPWEGPRLRRGLPGGGVWLDRSQRVSSRQAVRPIHSAANSALTRGWSPAGRWQDMACPHTGSCHGC